MPLGGLGFAEMVLIFAVLLLLFGAKRLPELASGMGRGIRDFKRALSGMDDAAINATPPQTPLPTPQSQPVAQAESIAPPEVAKREG